MSNSAFQPTVLTIPSTAGGTGQGELNLITNPVAAVNLDGWVGAERETSGGPLNPTIDTYFTILNAFGAESSTSGAYNVISLPSGLQNKKLKVEFYYTSPALDTFNVSVYKGTTRVPLTTDVSGSTALPQSTTGKFVTYFDTDSSGTWTVSITRTAGTGSTALQFTNVVVGPGIQPQGAVVGEWNTVSSPTIFGSTTNPTKGGTIYADVMYWRQVGSTMELRYQYRQQSAGTAGSGNYLFPIPAGLTINSAAIHSVGTSALPVFGSAFIGDAAYLSGSVIAASTTRLSLVFPAGGGTAGNSILGSGSTGYTLANANSSYGFEATIPIAEWAGSGTVQLAQNDVEFSSNSNATNAVSDGSSFAYGPAGSLIPNGAVGTAYDRTIRFQTPLQASDVLSVEVDQGMGLWVPVDRRLTAWVRQGSLGYGIYIEATTSTTVTVSFGSGGFRSSNATYAANGEAWSVVSGWKWRVRKSSAGAAVGFGIVAPGVSSGLVSASGLPGNTTGNAIASGYVGEVIASTSTSAVSTGTGGSTIRSISVTTTGVYRITANISLATIIQATANTYLAAAVNTTSAVAGGFGAINGKDIGYVGFFSNTAGTYGGLTLSFTAVVTAGSDLNLNANLSSGSAINVTGYIEATRIA